MAREEVILRVGGAAGDGIASTGESFAKICSRSGLHLLAYNSYQSVIRGGFIYLQLRQDVIKYFLMVIRWIFLLH